MEQKTLQQNKQNFDNLLQIFKNCNIPSEQIESIQEMGELVELLNSHYQIEEEEKNTNKDYAFEDLIKANKELTERVSLLEQSLLKNLLSNQLNEFKNECNSLKETSVSFYHKFYDCVADGLSNYYTKGKSSLNKTMTKLNEIFENYSKKMYKKLVKKHEASTKKHDKTIMLSELSRSFVDIAKNGAETVELKPYEKGIFKFMEHRIDKVMDKEIKKQEKILKRIESTQKKMIKANLNLLTNYQYDKTKLEEITNNIYEAFVELNQNNDMELKQLLETLNNTYNEQEMTPDMLHNLSNFSIFNKYLQSIQTENTQAIISNEVDSITSQKDQNEIPPIDSPNCQLEEKNGLTM